MRTDTRTEFPTLAPGMVVSHQDELKTMTVERISASRFGLTVSCSWFDGDALRYADVPRRQLDLFPHPVTSLAVRAGLEVRLRSGGPVMTVLSEDPKTHTVMCGWDGPGGYSRRRAFPRDCLRTSMFRQGPSDFLGPDSARTERRSRNPRLPSRPRAS
ncbi:MAG: hypothetical protein WBG08_05795 [Litorimonas sp.]